jgi:hypothetical protein
MPMSVPEPIPSPESKKLPLSVHIRSRASLCHVLLVSGQTVNDTTFISPTLYYTPISPESLQETDGTFKLEELRQV